MNRNTKGQFTSTAPTIGQWVIVVIILTVVAILSVKSALAYELPASPENMRQSFVDLIHTRGRMDGEYLSLIYKECNNDEETIRRILAVGIAETGLGAHTIRRTNFWGIFPAGNRGYDPSMEEMAKKVCEVFQKQYKNLIVNGNVNTAPLTLWGTTKPYYTWFVGYESPHWRANVEKIYKELE